MVDANTNEVLSTIDSVGVATNYDSPIARYYGTNPTRINQTRDLPDEFAGDTVYIRISTRRYGPTPFGMWLYLSPSNYSFSTFFEFGEKECFPLFAYNFNYWDFERYYYFPCLIEHLDSIVVTRGGPLKFDDLPIAKSWLNFDLADSVNNRYFDRFYINDTDYVWVERSDTIVPRTGSWIYQKNHIRKSITPQGIIITSFYDIETKSFIFYSNTKIENCKIMVFNLLGELLWEFQPINIPTELSKVIFPNSVIPNDIAIIRIVDSKGNNVFSGKEIIR